MPVNCAGLPETLLESELFGHVKGAFTGAYRDKPGKLERADEGTVFLDEIGEMTLRMQGLLLRFLETGEMQKVGADRAQRAVNVRVIAATNRNLQGADRQGQFREDLFYRFNVIHLWVPPLRERKEDIPALIDHFLRRFTRNNGHAGARHSIPKRSRRSSNIRGPATSASSRTWSSGWWSRAGTRGQARGSAGRNPRPARRRRRGPKRERRRTVADDLFKKLTEERESFWTVVYPLYMKREITRDNVRDLVRKGLEEARGNYKIVCAAVQHGSGATTRSS